MSKPGGSSDSQIEQAANAILGPPEDIASDLLRPIEREYVAQHLEREMLQFALVNRVIAVQRLTAERQRLEDGIHHLSPGDPLRVKPEKRIAELTAKLGALATAPVDTSNIIIELPPGPQPAGVKDPPYGGGNVVQLTTPRAGKARHRRRDGAYERIYASLREIAEARPQSHREVFEILQARKVQLPNSAIFASRGWLGGFHQNSSKARSWLSQSWARLNLVPFPRGPKGS